MNIIDLEEAKSQLEELVELAAQGETFILARGGSLSSSWDLWTPKSDRVYGWSNKGSRGLR